MLSADSRGWCVVSVLRRWWVWAGAAIVVLGVLVTWLVWPATPEPPPRARQYLEFTACLLTDAQGPDGPAAAPVWTGMKEASLATHAKVQYLAVPGEATVGNALPYLTGLIQRRCAVVLAVGPAQVEAVRQDASRYPQVRFVVVGASVPGTNVTVVNGLSGTGLRDRIRDLLTDVVHSASPR
jgi:hypothetical protein